MLKYVILADVLTAIHFAFVAFVVVGEVAILVGAAFRCRWARNPWFRALHLLAIAIVAAESILHLPCPLTVWEHDLREIAGQDPGTQTFVERLDLIFFMGGTDARPSLVSHGMAIRLGVRDGLAFVLIPPAGSRAAPRLS